MKATKSVWALPFLALAFTGTVSAEPQQASVEQRLERMERVLDSQSLLQMMERVDALQLEVQQLRGQLEEQQHQMEGMKNRQRELYLDVDRRMSRLEREGGGMAPQAPATGVAPSPQAPLTTGSTVNPATPVAVTPPVKTTAVEATTSEATGASSQLAEERAAYQKAFDLLRELRYEQASAAFRDFIKKYPSSRYAHIAQYWLGEAAYARRDFKQAIQDYQALLDNHPRSGKRADSMLKIGYSYQELKRTQDSKRMMERLIELYPDSTEAGQARNQLRRMKKSGG
jgi:tol-pal system protein YbgF